MLFEEVYRKKIEHMKKDEDYEIMESIAKNIIDVLKENGVAVKGEVVHFGDIMTDGNTVKQEFSVIFNGLDFAEHDKKYVDKIKALKNQISELEFRLENEKERNEIKEKCAIDEIVDIAINMNYAIREKDEKISKFKFKLSCAEAEIDIAKELLGKCPNLNEDDIKFVEKEFGIKIKAPRTDFFTKIGLDDEIKVKLTPYGVDIYRFHHIKLKEEGAVLFKSENVDVDKKGYTRFKMRDFMKIYGKYIDLFDRKVIEPADIILCD